MTTRKMTISMPAELYAQTQKFKRNWSKIARRSFEHEIRIQMAMANEDRIAALRAKAEADCVDIFNAGYEDALTYPIDKIHYADLRSIQNLFDAGEATLDAFTKFNSTSPQKYALKFSNNVKYVKGFVAGLCELKNIADSEPGR